MTKAAFLELMRDARRTLNDAISGLTEEQLTREATIGTWSIKDVLAHLGAWDGEVLIWLERSSRGEEIGPFIDESVDEWNTQRVAERRRLPLVDVMQEFNENFDQLLAQLERAPDDAIPLGPNGWDSSARLWWLTEHEQEHASAIKEYRQRVSVA